MTLSFVADTLWPYLVVLLVGALPTEIWRSLAVVLARGVSDNSPVFVWVRYVATALLAGVVAKLLTSPSGALAAISGLGRASGIIAAFAAFLLFRRSVLSGVVAGEVVLLAFAFLG
jgi:hypothetical protein